MILLTRRGVLAGATALAAGGLVRPRAARAAERTNHAVLVACTAYPNLPPKVALIGPNHDAVLVRDYLLTRAPVPFEAGNVAVLADGLDGATASPTHENIRAALQAVADRAVPGDFVYLHLSGHGAQQPETKAGDETDGLDEIFLPADTGKWVDRDKGVPNALVDDDIGAALDAIRAKGAFIWVIFDCCHSGSATRAAPVGEDLVAERKVEFADLLDDGVRQEGERAFAQAASNASQASDGSRDVGGAGGQKARQAAFDVEPTGAVSIAKGGLVAFFAAQTIETTPEMPLPKGAEDAVKYGLFTYTIFSKLAENPNVTYRQLGHAVLQQYSADARQRPTPLFEGELDARVFGSERIDMVMQWPLEVKNGAATLPAGQLHRLAKGTRLAVLPSPTSELDQAVGYVEVQSARNLTSRVVPVAHEGLPALAVADVPANSWARLTELAIGFELVVARPGGDGSPAETELLNAALDKIVDEKKVPVNLRLVDAGEAADLTLAVMSEMDVGIVIADQARQSEDAARASLSTEPRVWLLPPSAELSLEDGRRSPSLPLAGSDVDDIAAKLAEDLVRIFRATSLSRLSAASEFRPNEVDVGFKIKRTQAADAEPLRAGTVPVVHPDDEVHIEAKSASAKPVDINVLYIGSDYSISHMYAERLSSGSEIDLPLLAFTDSSYGIERMVVVLSEAEPQTPVEDLSFLEQVGIRQATRSLGGGAASFSELLREVAAAPATRGAARLGDKAGAKGAVLIFPMETTPRG
jgi:hypothetical protein